MTADHQAQRGSGQRLTDQAAGGAGYLGGGNVTTRPMSITWTFPFTDVLAWQFVLAARVAADRLNPGDWITTADDHA